MAEDVIGTAIVNLKANTSGFLGEITNAVSAAEGQFSKMGSGMKGAMSGMGTVMTAGITAPLIGIGAFAIESSKTVGGAFKEIEKQTGLTGAQLDKMKDSFRNVFSNVPADANTVASALSTISGRLTDLNGGIAPTQSQIEGLTTQFIQFGKVTGTDAAADADTLTRAWKAMGVSAEDAGPQLDMLLTAAQDTRVPVSELMGQVKLAGPTFTQMGFSATETTAMLAQLDAGGIKTQSAIMGMNRVLKESVDSGVPAQKAWANLVTELKSGNISTKTATELTKELGTRGYAQLATAAKNGTLDIDGLTRAMRGNQDAVKHTYEDTMTFSDKLTIFKNKLMVAFEPLGKALINVGMSILNMLTPVIPIVTNLINLFAKAPAPLQMIVLAIGGILAALGPVLIMATKLHGAFTSLKGVVEAVAPKIASVMASAGGGGGGLLSKIPGLGGGAMAAEGGGVAAMGPLAELAPLLVPVLAIVLAIGAAFAVLYTTSSTFRGLIGGVVEQFKQLFAWAGKFVGVLMSGDLGKAGDMLKTAFSDVGHMLATIDWGDIGNKLITSVIESLSTIGNAIRSVDWGGMLFGLLSAFDNILTQILNFDWGGLVIGFVNAIIGMFGGAGGGGGKAGTTVQKGMSTALTTGVAKAGPDILGKLGDVFIKLLAVVPVIFMKIGVALLTALSKVDWGQLALRILAALTGIGVQFLTALKNLDWGGFAQAVINFLVTNVPAVLNAIKNLDWGGFARAVINFLVTNAPTFFNAVKNLDWGGFARTVISDIVNLAGEVLTAFMNLDWGGLGNTIINGITSLAGNVLSAFVNLDWGSLGSAVAGAISGALGSISGGAVDTLKHALGLQHGGLVTKPTLAMIGEAGPELVLPVPSGLKGITSVAPAATTTTTTTAQHTMGDINVHFNIASANLSSQAEAEKFGRIVGYQATEMLRRAGHNRG